MKKFLIGCGVLALLLIVLAVGLAVFVGVKIKGMANAYEQAANEIHQVQEDYPFDAPEDRSMDPDRFEAYLIVRDKTVDRFLQIPAIGEIVAAAQEKRKADLSFGDVVSLAMTKLPPAMSDVALIMREQEMSPIEFNYYSETTLLTIKYAADNGNEEMIDLWENLTEMIYKVDDELRNNQNADVNINLDRALRDLDDSGIPQANIDMILQHRDKLEERPMVIVIEMVIREAFKDWQRQQQRQMQYQQQNSDSSTSDADAGEPALAQ
ncbi:hypothetical protein KQI84_10330 [bacterium]|nr:hypothetical protein [bacterium]